MIGSPKLFVSIGSLFCFLSVAAGAFGAHLLKGKLPPDLLAVFETAAKYQMYHGLSLLFVAWAIERWERPALSFSAWFFVAGVILFSGSLYLLSLTGHRWLGAITPLGGLLLMAGWLMLFIVGLRA